MTVELIKRKGLSDEGYGGVIGVFGACRHPAPFDFMMLHWKGGRISTAAGTPYGYTRFSFEQGIRLVEKGQFNYEKLITHRFPLDAIGTAFDMIMNQRDRYVKVLVDPWAKVQDPSAGPEAYRIFDEHRNW